jgi:hypothetical protein
MRWTHDRDGGLLAWGPLVVHLYWGDHLGLWLAWDRHYRDAARLTHLRRLAWRLERSDVAR